MPFVSITRLRVRSIRFLPFFVRYAYRSVRQVKTSPGVSMWRPVGGPKLDLLDDDRLGKSGEYAALHDDRLS